MCTPWQGRGIHGVASGGSSAQGGALLRGLGFPAGPGCTGRLGITSRRWERRRARGAAIMICSGPGRRGAATGGPGAVTVSSGDVIMMSLPREP
jgi:hypothetical protein